MVNTIKLRRGTAAQWTAANPVLADGEPGFERDTGKQKIGDGTTAWSGLDYYLPEPAVEQKVADGVAPVATTTARERSLARRKVAATSSSTGVTATIVTAAGSLETDIVSPVQDWLAQTYCRFTLCGNGAPVVVAGVGYKGDRARPASGGDVWGDDSIDVMVNDADGTVEMMTQIVQSGYQYARLYVDDALVLDWNAAYAVDQRYRIKIVFDAARSKTAHLRLVTTLGIRHLNTGQHGSVWKPTHPLYRGVAVGIGDSFLVGAQDNAYASPKGGYFRRLTEQFRIDGRRVGYSGTGLTTDGGGASGKDTYPARVAGAKTSNGPCDFGILQLSTNDGGATQAAITAAMTTFVTNWRAEFGARPIFVIGVARGIPLGPSTVNCDAIDNGVKAVMDANPDLFPYPLVSTAGWWTGNGYVGTAASSTPKGTTETGIATDGIHPTNAGHDLLADRAWTHLAAFLALADVLVT